jgi:hypothetical protein
MEFRLFPLGGRVKGRVGWRAATRWRRDTPAELLLNSTIADGRMTLRYLVRYTGLLRPFSARIDRAPVRL